MNQQLEEEKYSDYDQDIEEIDDLVPEEKKYTPLWAWVPFCISVLCYMLIYIFLFDLSFEEDLTSLNIPAGLLILAVVLEYLIRDHLNRDSKILKYVRWILLFFYGILTLIDIASVVWDALTLSLINVLGLAGTIGMVVALIYAIIRDSKNDQ